VLSEHKVSNGALRSVTFSDDGGWLAICTDDSVAVWRGQLGDNPFDTLAGDVVYQWDMVVALDGLSQPGPVAFNAGGTLLALTDSGGAVRVYDLKQRSFCFERGNGSRVRAVAFVAGFESLLLGREDGVVELVSWSERARGTQREVRLPGRIGALGACSAQDAIVLYDVSGVARADLVAGEGRGILAPSNAWLNAAFFDEGRFVVRTGHQATIEICDNATGQTLSTTQVKGGNFDSAVPSENGIFLATARRDLVQLWGIGTRALGRYTREDYQHVQELLRAAPPSSRSANLRLLVELIEAAVDTTQPVGDEP
jgi:WD40 repeat protein